LPRAETCLNALAAMPADDPWLTGTSLTLADLHAAPMFAYFRMAPEGSELLSRHPGLVRWWDAMAARDSMASTRSSLE
jgi:glutathione S-transferase